MKKKILSKNLLFLVLIVVVVTCLGVAWGTSYGKTYFSASYISGISNTKIISFIERTNDSLNAVYMDYFELNKDGSLKINRSLDTKIIKEIHERGILAVPYLTNHWNRDYGEAALKNRNNLSTEIAAAIKKYNLDGVNIDIENMTEKYREEYVDFVKQLGEKLPGDKNLSVAVAVNPEGLTKGWCASYDYKNLAKYCDYLIIMAYDDNYMGCEKEGPVASGDFVEKSIEYAIKNAPSSKIVLGIPFYGRYWKKGEINGGYGIKINEVETMLARYTSEVKYDNLKKSYNAKIIIKDQDVLLSADKKKLTPGIYSVWFEGEKSYKHKLGLISRYNLKGVASWSLGQESENIWQYYKKYLNNNYLIDVNNHWAAESINYVNNLGLMNGISSNKFEPDKYITKAEIAAILVRYSNIEDNGDSSPFLDTDGHWAEKSINIAWQNSIMFGNTQGYFEPEKNVSRGEMAEILYRTVNNENLPEVVKNIYYKDVDNKSEDAIEQSIIKMSKMGVCKGFSDGYFCPKVNVTRAQTAILLKRIYDLKNKAEK